MLPSRLIQIKSSLHGAGKTLSKFETLTKLNTATMLMEKYLLAKEDAYGMTCVTITINH